MRQGFASRGVSWGVRCCNPAPSGQRGADMVQGQKQAFVQQLIPQTTVKAFDEGILGWARAYLKPDEIEGATSHERSALGIIRRPPQMARDIFKIKEMINGKRRRATAPKIVFGVKFDLAMRTQKMLLKSRPNRCDEFISKA